MYVFKTFNILYWQLGFCICNDGGVDPHFENKKYVTVYLTMETAGG